MLTTRQKADYLMQVVKLRKLMILKDNPAFTYQHSNRKQAISRVHSLQDKIVEAAVDNQVYGNSDSVNHQKTVEQTISEALENDRKRVYKSDDNRYINTAVKLNTEKYSEILNNRLNIESVKLEAKIEEEIRKSKYNGLSEAEIKRKLTEEFKDTAKLRTANIIRDALHTNEVNIGFIHALQNGFQYKVWNNGRGKGKVRAWHRARFISSVSIDEPFDIFGSYHAEMMYPGDLNGGAENVANCRCWLSYTNNRPSNLRRKGSSSRSNSKSTQNNKAKTSNKKSIGSRIKSTYDSAIERIQNKLKQIKNLSNKKNISSRIKDKLKTAVNNKIDSALNRVVNNPIITLSTILLSSSKLTQYKQYKNKRATKVCDSYVEEQRLYENEKSKSIIDKWSGNYFKSLNKYIRGSITVSKKQQEVYDKFKLELSFLINSTSGLREDTILFRGEKYVDLSRFKEGEINSFDGFISSSFDMKVAKNFAKTEGYFGMEENPYVIKIKAKKGTKGIAINGKELGEYTNQREWLLNHGQKYITKNIDYKNRMIEIELI